MTHSPFPPLDVSFLSCVIRRVCVLLPSLRGECSGGCTHFYHGQRYSFHRAHQLRPISSYHLTLRLTPLYGRWQKYPLLWVVRVEWSNDGLFSRVESLCVASEVVLDIAQVFAAGHCGAGSGIYSPILENYREFTTFTAAREAIAPSMSTQELSGHPIILRNWIRKA